MRALVAATILVAGLPLGGGLVPAVSAAGAPGAGGAVGPPAAPPGAAPPAAGAPEANFGEAIDVRLVTVVVRVVDDAGEPIAGLTPADFRVRVGKKEVPVTAVDWTSSGEPAVPPDLAVDSGTFAGAAAPATGVGLEAAAEGAAAEPRAAPGIAPGPPPGKLVVFFVEADNNEPGRVRGHLRTLPFTRELLAALQPEDRVAVVSFDSHLKLWRDFTREREAIPGAIYQAILFGATPPEVPGSAPASLAGHFDLRKARDAASPERALEVMAEALAPLPGEKIVVMLGWGMGTFSSFGTQMAPAFAPAVRALKAARASVFVLDVTEAAAHDLELGLRAVAEETGGTYDKTNLFPALAMRQLARTISGYYLLTLDPDTLPRTGGWLSAELRGRAGTVLVRPVRFPAAAR